MAFRLIALGGVLALLSCSSATITADPQKQRAFSSSFRSDDNISMTTPSILPGAVQLSHSGLYITSPISSHAPQYLVLSTEASLYDVGSVRINVGSRKRRNWEQVHLDCGSLSSGGGIEACESDDLNELTTNETLTTISCEPYKIIPSQSRVLIDKKSCPSLYSLLATSSHAEIAESYLDSLTLQFDIQRNFPSRKERHAFWIGRLVRAAEERGGDGKALWPYAITNHDKTQLPWDGKTPNRISSQMQDPFLPKSNKADATDVLNGVDLVDSSWSLGISIQSPTNGNHSRPTDREFEPVHAPVGGQIVWKGNYTIPRPPSNHRNDEHGYAVLLRDEWGFVYHLLGLNASAIHVDLGQIISAGHIIGSTSRSRIAVEPICRHKPADPPEMWDDSRRYPFRNRLLRIMVARPDPSWTEWKGPLQSGWQYFNPLDAFTSDDFKSTVPPDPNPDEIFFARPSEDGGLTPPSVFATTKDFSQPSILSGSVEIILGFDSFIATPGNAGDALDPTALHALEWAAWPRSEGGNLPEHPKLCLKPEDVEWRTTFEHSKLSNEWANVLVKNALLAHYVPAFASGTVPLFKSKFASVFDEKGRKLFYSPTRSFAGLPSGGGSWDTRREPNGNGDYRIIVRGRDWFGNQGCFAANVRIQN
ncbi:hypothetical protein CBS101457_004004 [Exobasidium rhododendri]|nr:hypothetical protein CBS101457_004004 [Exobasidium rhododendri]